MKIPAFCSRLAVIITTVFFCNLLSSPDTPAYETDYFPVYKNVPLPDKISLCGEMIPLEDPYAREMLDREFTIAVWNQAQTFMWLKRAGRYFPYIENELAKAGLPDDLKYLAIAESSLIPNIRSSSGAMGIWQFMPATGEEYGLQNTASLDERRYFEKSTEAAIKMLGNLRQRFGSWSLAMAAYNCGPRCIENAITNQKVSNYYRLSLPQETERYIFKIATIKIILENPNHYGYFIPPHHIYEPTPADTIKIQLQYPLSVTDVAIELGTDFKMIKELNPHLIGSYLPEGRYYLKVPSGKGQKLFAVIDKLSKKAIEKRHEYYIVQTGDNLFKISSRTGVSVSQIKALNSIKDDIIKVGQRLRIN